MDRRRFLESSLTALPLGIAGCYSEPDSEVIAKTAEAKAGRVRLERHRRLRSEQQLRLPNENKRGVYSSDPMEPSASISRFDPSHQGRAPYWSPDGSRIVFESNRAGGYALYLANPKTGKPPRQLTDPLYGAQHGKFFPSGTKLVFTALQEPSASGEGPRGIATIEISDYHR